MRRDCAHFLVSFICWIGLPLVSASAQWIAFEDWSAGVFAPPFAGTFDDREKDCAVGDFDRDGWDDIVVVRNS